ncbi:MAG: hypothetical protein OXN83_03995 [Oligoflexia bacterium]|nr:hypothetical protein [Oligoflexia bacterium]
MKSQVFFLTVFVLLDISISYAEFIPEHSKCRNSFISFQAPITKSEHLDYFRNLFPQDHEIQKNISFYKEDTKTRKKIEYFLFRLEKITFDQKNEDFLIQQISAQPHLLNFQNQAGQNLLHLAVIYNNFKVSKFLTQFTKLLNKKDIAGNTPILLSMTRMQNIDIFKLLVTHPLIDLLVQDSFEQNILHYIFLGKEGYRNEMLDLLFERLDLNTISNLTKAINKQGESPLNYLIRDFNITIANKFAKIVPANFLRKLKNGNTLLHVASSIPNLKAIKFLLEHFNQINEANHFGQIPVQTLTSYHLSLTEQDINTLLLNSKKRSQL